jgi:hypothetical protein
MFFIVGGREWGTTPEEEPQLLLPDTGTASYCWQVQEIQRQHYIAGSSVADP